MGVLHGMERYKQDSGLLFPSPRGGGELSSSALSKTFLNLSVPGGIHGLRNSFRDWPAESGVDRVLAELALAHVDGSEAERAY